MAIGANHLIAKGRRTKPERRKRPYPPETPRGSTGLGGEATPTGVLLLWAFVVVPPRCLALGGVGFLSSSLASGRRPQALQLYDIGS